MQDNHNKESIICLSHNENALMFNAIGIKGLVVNDKEKLFEEVKELEKKGIKIFLVSDLFTEEIEELRSLYEGAYPIFLLLPLDGIVNGEGVERIRKNVEKATGINLF